MNKIASLLSIVGLTVCLSGAVGCKKSTPPSAPTQSEYDSNGFDKHGKHKDTKTKYDKSGHNKDGVDQNGFRRDGTHLQTKTKFGPNGRDKYGFNDKGFNDKGIHKDTKDYFNKLGLDQHGNGRDGSTGAEILDKLVTANQLLLAVVSREVEFYLTAPAPQYQVTRQAITDYLDKTITYAQAQGLVRMSRYKKALDSHELCRRNGYDRAFSIQVVPYNGDIFPNGDPRSQIAQQVMILDQGTIVENTGQFGLAPNGVSNMLGITTPYPRRILSDNPYEIRSDFDFRNHMSAADQAKHAKAATTSNSLPHEFYSSIRCQ